MHSANPRIMKNNFTSRPQTSTFSSISKSGLSSHPVSLLKSIPSSQGLVCDDYHNWDWLGLNSSVSEEVHEVFSSLSILNQLPVYLVIDRGLSYWWYFVLYWISREMMPFVFGVVDGVVLGISISIIWWKTQVKL